MPAAVLDTPLLRHVADLLRVLAAVSIVVAGVSFGLGDGVRFLVLAVLLIAVRIFGLIALVDVLVCLTAVVATWAAVLDWYVTIGWMDEVVHLVAVGVLAAACVPALGRVGALPSLDVLAEQRHRLPVVLVVTGAGFTIACLWEFVEWVGEQLSPATIHVGYGDTISDLALGGLGALMAAILVALRAESLQSAEERARAAAQH